MAEILGALEKHLVMLYLYSILAAVGVSFCVSLQDQCRRDFRSVTLAGMAGFGWALVLAVVGPYAVFLMLRESYRDHRDNPYAAVAILAAALVFPIVFTACVPTRATVLYFAITLGWMVFVALYVLRRGETKLL